MMSTSEDRFFFIPVADVCHRPVITCLPDHGVIEMSRMMKAHNISGIIVMENEKPVGIVSLRDLRNLIADEFESIPRLTARDVMKTALITLCSSDYLFKAIFLMAKHNIHRLLVVDESGNLAGVITDTDLLRVQTQSPLYLVQEIESARSIDQLRVISQKMLGMLHYAVKTNADAKSLIQLIAHFNDALTQRLIHILGDDIRLPSGTAYLSLGSEGRQEQTIRTDQDSAIVYRDDLSSQEIGEVHRFADHIVMALESVGVPLCPGNIMANNPEWCHSISEWKQLIEKWISSPDPDATVHFGVFQDLRVIHGDITLESQLRNYIRECAHNHSIFFPSMARNIVRFKTPVGMFGRLLVEKKGDQRGKLDLKKGGLFALTRGISLIALEAGIMGGTTWSKLKRLHNLHMISEHDLEIIHDAFTFLIKMRLNKQLIALSSGKEPSNFVDPMILTDNERDQLRKAFRGVDTLLHILQSRYQLDMMSR